MNATVAQAASVQDRTVTFWVNFEAPSSSGYQMGMHELKVDKRQLTLSDLKLMGQSHGNFLASQGGVFYDGTFYCNNGEESYGIFSPYIFHYREADDWKFYAMYDTQNPGFVADMVTLNPASKKAYGTFVTEGGEYDFELCEVDYQRQERRFIAKAEHRYCAMAIDRRGRWLGITGLGDLYEIDTETGRETLIGSTGLRQSASDGAGFFAQTGCYDPASDLIFWGRTDLEGKSAIYAVDPVTAKAELYAELPNYTLMMFMTVRESYVTTAAPAAVTGLTATTTADQGEATVSFTMPARTIGGGTLTGAIDYDIVVDGTSVKKSTAAAGVAVSEQLMLAAGIHRVDVVTSNAAGEGLLAFTPVMVGYDRPDITGPVSLLVEKTKATLSWPAAVGELGGNVGDVTYTVTRYPDNKVVATDLAATSYTDATLPGGALVKYSYGIVPKNSAATGREKRSNGQVGGDAREVPYYVKARTDVEEQDFSFVDANGDGITWETSSYWGFIRFSSSSFLSRSYTMQLSDDWLFLPALSLKAGRQYQLEYDEWGSKGFDNSEKMEVKIGSSMTPESQTKTIAARYEIPKDDPKHRTFTFKVDADGDYYIGFHVAGATYEPSNDVQLTTVAVVETPASNAPAAVDNLSVKAGAGGDYSATVSLTAPKQTIGGSALSQVSNVRIYRNNTLIHTFGASTAGTPLTFTDTGLTSADNGVVQYVVVAANEAGDGEAAVNEVFVGVDKPTVDGITGSVSEKDGKLVFNWTPASTVGAKEGYVDPALVTYYLYEVAGARYNPLGNVTGKTTFEYDFDYNAGEQKQMRFALGTANAAGYLENAVVDLGTHVVGEPYRLPFSESLEGGKDSKYFFWNTYNSTSKIVVANDDSYDGDGGCYQWSGNAVGNYYSLNLGKVSLRGASNPMLVFAYKFAAASNSIAVSVQKPDGTVVDLQKLAASSGGVGSWQVAKIDLGDYLGEEYVLLKLRMESNAPTASVKIDAINVMDMPNYNLGVALTSASQLRAGAPAEVSIVVRNVGDRDMSDFTVSLYEGNSQVFTQDVTADLSTLQRKVIAASYIPNVFNAGQRVTLRAEVSAARDRTEDDNSYEQEVTILPSVSPQPENLQGTTEGSTLALTWETPNQESVSVTETFEGSAFTNLSSGGIDTGVKEGVLGNGWTLYDGDSSLPSFPDGVTLLDDAKRSAWVIFDASSNESLGITPYSGNRFIVSFDNTGTSYNWLISPAMTGQAQTIHFFATEPAGFERHETIQVLASSTDTSTGTGRNAGYADNTGSFTVVDEFQATGNGWDEFHVDLPQGTKYFAIRSASPLATGRFLCIDDITYEVGSGAVVKYNIYADGVLLGSTTNATTTAYTIAQASANVRYAVTAVYEGGRESAPVYYGQASGIDGITIDDSDQGPYYNLNGQRVSKPTKKGVYVANGHKVIIEN